MGLSKITESPFIFDDGYGGIVSILDDNSISEILNDKLCQTKFVSFCPRNCLNPQPENVVVLVVPWMHENINHYTLLGAMEKATGSEYVPIDGGLLERYSTGSGIGVFADSHLIQGQISEGRKISGLNYESSRNLTIRSIQHIAQKAGRSLTIGEAPMHRRHPGW